MGISTVRLFIFYAVVVGVVVYNIGVPGKTVPNNSPTSVNRELWREKYARLLDGGDSDSPTTSPGPTTGPTTSEPTFSPTTDAPTPTMSMSIPYTKSSKSKSSKSKVK